MPLQEGASCRQFLRPIHAVRPLSDPLTAGGQADEHVMLGRGLQGVELGEQGGIAGLPRRPVAVQLDQLLGGAESGRLGVGVVAVIAGLDQHKEVFQAQALAQPTGPRVLQVRQRHVASPEPTAEQLRGRQP